MADGKIVIETELTTDKFDKQIAQLEKKNEKLEQKYTELDIKLNDNSIKEAQQKFGELSTEADQLKKKLEMLEEKRRISIETGIPIKTSDYLGAKMEWTSRLEEVNEKLSQQSPIIDKNNEKIIKTLSLQQNIRDQIDENNLKIQQLSFQKQNEEAQKLRENIGKSGNSLKEAIKQAGKYALAIFGIRSAYIAVRRASSELANYDKQYAANLEYIRYALTQAIAPVLRWIVEMATKLLQIIGMLINALFGVNIFAKASAKSFQKMKAGAGGTAKAAKEIKKQLAGFDELNVLQDNGNASSGGAGGVSLPNTDLSKMGEAPEWMQWIAKHKAEILSALAGIIAFLIAMKSHLGLIKSLGIGIAVAGIVYAIQGLLQYLKDPTWSSFGQMVQGIGIAIIGLGVAFLGLPAVITGAIVLIVGTIMRYWTEIKTFLQGGIDWLTSKGDWVQEKFGIVGRFLYDLFINILQGLLNNADATFVGIRGVFDGFITFLKGIFTGNWKMAWEGIKKIFTSIIDTMAKYIKNFYNTVMSYVIKVAQKVGSVIASAFKAIVNTILGAIENILNAPIRQINALVDIIRKIPGVSADWHLEEFHLPRLAKGGLINVPGKGTLVGGGTAIAGERGVEGVIPLTDNQAMEQLGEAIGRYITINANIVNKMNGRTISRELKQIQNNQDFAYNT